MSEISVRRAAAKDASAVVALLVALAEYEKLAPPDAAAQERLTSELSATSPRFEA
jgi:hypothetical protein